MFEKLKNIMRDTVCRRFLHHIVWSYYIWDNVCRTFMRHIVVSYYIKATDVKKNGNPFCSKLLHFAYRCQCKCKAKCSNYYILQRYYILGCDSAITAFAVMLAASVTYKWPFRVKHYEVSLSLMLHDILGHDHVQWHPQLIRHYTNLRTYCRTGLYYRFLPYYQILEVSIEYCNECG